MRLGWFWAVTPDSWLTIAFVLFHYTVSSEVLTSAIVSKVVCWICADPIQLYAISVCKLQSQNQVAKQNPNYPETTWASIEDDRTKTRPCTSPYHERKQDSLSIRNQGVTYQMTWMPCLCPHGPKMFGIYWMSHKTCSHMPRLNPDHRHRRHAWTHRHQTGNINTGLMWHLLMSLGSACTTDGHAWVRQRVGERLEDCCIQETVGICIPTFII